jgi:hypothetical protein
MKTRLANFEARNMGRAKPASTYLRVFELDMTIVTMVKQSALQLP